MSSLTGIPGALVGNQLGISSKTVRNVVSRILSKLRVATREHAVRHAREHGLGGSR